MASGTYTKDMEMKVANDKTAEMSTSSIKGMEINAAHSFDEEDNWSILSSTSSNEPSVTEEQHFISSPPPTSPFSDTEVESEAESEEAGSEDESICESDDESCHSISSDNESICESSYSTSSNESTCTEEQELDHARKCENLESLLKDFQNEIEECWSERVQLVDEQEAILKEKNDLVLEKHDLLNETNLLLKQKKDLVDERVELLEVVEGLTVQRSTNETSRRLEIGDLKSKHSKDLTTLQHVINEKTTMLVEKQELLEVAEALAKENRDEAVRLRLGIEENEMAHVTDISDLVQVIHDKTVLLTERQKLLDAAEALAEQKSQDAEKSNLEIQRLREQEVATFDLMQKTIETLKNEHAQELRDTLTHFETLENVKQQEFQMYQHESDEQYKYLKDTMDHVEKERSKTVASSKQAISDLEMAKSELAHTKAWCDEVQDELALAQKERDDLRTELADVKVDRDEVESTAYGLDLEMMQMADLACEKEEAEKKLLAVQEELATANSDLAHTKARCYGVEMECVDLRYELSDDKTDRNELEADFADIVFELEEVEEKLDGAHEELAKANIEYLKIKEELVTANNKGLKLEAELQEKTNNYREHLSVVREELTAGLRDARATRDRLIANVSAVKDLIEEHRENDPKRPTTEEKLATANKDCHKLEKELENQKFNHRQHLDQMTAYQHELKGDLYEAKSERDTLQNRLDAINDARNNLDEELEEIKCQRDDLQRKFQDMKMLHNQHLDEMRSDLSETKLSRDAYQEQLRQSAADRTALKEELVRVIRNVRFGRDVDDLTTEHTRLEVGLEGIESEDKDLTIKHDHLRMALEKAQALEEDYLNLQSELNDVRKEMERVKGDRNSLQGELNDLMIKHDIVEEKLEEAMAAGNSLEDEMVDRNHKEQVELMEAKKKLQTFHFIFPVVEKYSGHEFEQSLTNAADDGHISMEKLETYVFSMMARPEKEL
ncbi:hypothetical protein D6D17_07446 [Aureobasidium pullulans]|uniref:Uncharacterized protein n=1 Tax=Aureobasidium pullulans TaxID=5580 RepID=A0A4S9BT41_AURPU|nr:hypothetical protein D6D29_09488 [Aureobasidium pullulans]THW96086.1 hypothetical protein D6D17_07446 [Aureobasidium pullulans]THX27723.1 hypothetical protein D6D12_05348 [Aureobasidium pullulans]THX46662.1 hypothetical protein D6D11_06763 [Aureobasidium pullulans]THX77818.1 hypothetical protein D6D04_06113 [Aureobasidium pullulans]